jgi:membrane-associated phospholipid phosphatase
MNLLPGERRVGLLTGVALVLFLLLAIFRTEFQPLDLSINHWSASINGGFFTFYAEIISVAFDTIALLVASLVMAALLFAFHHRRFSLLLLGAMGGDVLLVTLSKILVSSPRPLNGIIAANGFSFPSGHTTSTFVLLGLLTYFAWMSWPSLKNKALTSGAFVSVTGIVGFDRIYLNVHWATDVIGAVLLGSFWLLLCILVFSRLQVMRKRWRRSAAMPRLTNQLLS